MVFILSVWLLSPPWPQCFFNLTHGLNQRSTRVFKFLRNLAVGANSHSVGVEIFLILSHVFVFYVCIYFCSQQHKTKLFSFKTYFPKMMRPPNFCKDMFSIFYFYCLKIYLFFSKNTCFSLNLCRQNIFLLFFIVILSQKNGFCLQKKQKRITNFFESRRKEK